MAPASLPLSSINLAKASNDPVPGPSASVQERYDYILRVSLPLGSAWQATNPVVVKLVETLQRRGVLLRAPLHAEIDAKIDRMGLTVITPGKPPLVWINVRRHGKDKNFEVELHDTLIHEAIHASAAALQRHTILPEDTASTAYIAEEVCAHFGTSHVQAALGLKGDTWNKKQAQKHQQSLRNDIASRARHQGRAAAEWLLENS